jgi:hypothetical protein
MAEPTNAKFPRPTVIELRTRVVAAIETFIIERTSDEWLVALSSNEYRLLVDDGYRVSIKKIAAPAAAMYLSSDALREIGLDPWVVELGGRVKDAALDLAAESVVRKLAALIHEGRSPVAALTTG